jgi:uncharacterized repeat protein (TIGR03803 family)
MKINITIFLTLTIFIFNAKNTDAQYTFNVLHSFNGTDGATGKGSLVLYGNSLYGYTSAGGANISGTIFKINLDGSGFQVLYSFTGGINNYMGNEPHHDAMLIYNSKLYGNALYGGYSDYGVLFKIDTNGVNYDTIKTFYLSTQNCSNPHSGLVYKNPYFYGIAEGGGTNGIGAIFRIKPDGTDFSLIYSFSQSTGYEPHGRLTFNSDSTIVYGTTKLGGTVDSGVVFRFNLNSSQYDTIYVFRYGTNRAVYSEHGYLTYLNDTLYGLTRYGGSAYKGAVFAICQNGTGYRLLHSFGTITSDGYYPYGSLTYSNGYLYGTTRIGGANNYGTIFRIKTDGTSYDTLKSLSVATNGGKPIDNITFNSSGSVLYGITQVGGANDPTGTLSYGTIFSITLSVSVKKISTEIPCNYTLYQNYPNPFNPSTNIKYEIINKGLTTLKVYDILGKEIESLVNETQSPGTYTVDWNAGNYPSGVYFYRLKTDNFTGVKRMLLVK